MKTLVRDSDIFLNIIVSPQAGKDMELDWMGKEFDSYKTQNQDKA